MKHKKKAPVVSGGGLNTDSGEYTGACPNYTRSIEEPIQTECSGSEKSAATVDELTTAPDASCTAGNPSDGSGNVTVLVCERDKSATKTIRPGENGELYAQDFDAGLAVTGFRPANQLAAKRQERRSASDRRERIQSNHIRHKLDRSGGAPKRPRRLIGRINSKSCVWKLGRARI